MLSRRMTGRGPGGWGLAVVMVLLGGFGSEVRAQVAPAGFFTDPVLILTGGGHHAPVRSMVFATPTGSQLLTGGMDKVVQVWNLDADRSGPARTLRPPNWRGARGQINALALSPVVAGNPQRILAVGGHGVLGDLGEILLFRYPGLTGQGTGDVIGQLSRGDNRPGHTNVVTSLAFTPDGRFLGSSSNDGSVRVWDVAGRRQVASLTEAQAEVNSLALFARGTRLVSGGTDGVVRLYDLTNPALPRFLAQYPPGGRAAPFPLENQILGLAASPDDQWVVVGTEGGGLIRLDAANLGGAIRLKAVNDPLTGPVEALAISPDGTRLATSTIEANLGANRAGFPTVGCVVEIRSMPLGQVLERYPPTSNLVQALAFSPDGSRLAYSGGDAQSVYVKDLAPGSPQPEALTGDGASVWDVGFRGDSRAIRLARKHPPTPGQAEVYDHFDLRGRHFFTPEAGEPVYRHAQAAEAGWTITPVDPFQLDFRDAQGRGWRRSLDPTNERRWWAYTVIPPGPGHPQPVAAVAADAGVVLWNLVTGEKTRSLSGHAGPVYAIASSPDGRWLVTGSSDQTVRLWTLAGCDRAPAFGARFEREGAVWKVAEVSSGGFADGIGLRPGQVIEATFVGDFGPAVAVDPGSLLPTLDRESPTRMFSFYARVPGGEQIRVASTKRDSPALTLFPGLDHRWVLWTPRGFYDSSADGDRQFLGWLTNRGTVNDLRTGSFDSIDKFEARYRQTKGAGNVLDRLLDTADPLQAVALPVVAAAPAPSPVSSRLEEITLAPAVVGATDRPLAVGTPEVALDYRVVASPGASPITRIWVEVNGERRPDLLPANGAPVAQAQGRVVIPMGPEREVRANLVAIDGQGVRRVRLFDLSNALPPPPNPRRGRLEILAIGAGEFADKRLARVPYAEEDARDLNKFLAERLVAPSTGVRFPSDQIHAQTFLGGQVARDRLLGEVEALRKAVAEGRLARGDVVAVVVESHFLEVHSRRLLATAEAVLSDAEPPAILATDLADRLAELTAAGCRVVILIDAVHEIPEGPFENEIQEYARLLQARANVLTFLASDHGPSSPNGDGHRVFAQQVLDVLKVSSPGRARKGSASNSMSIFDFQRTVVDGVLQKTGRRQHAQLLLPETLPYSTPFLDPSTPPGADPGSSQRARRVARGDSISTRREVGPSSSIRTHQVVCGSRSATRSAHSTRQSRSPSSQWSEAPRASNSLASVSR